MSRCLKRRGWKRVTNRVHGLANVRIQIPLGNPFPLDRWTSDAALLRGTGDRRDQMQ